MSSLVSDCVSLWSDKDETSKPSTASPRSSSSSYSSSSDDKYLSGEGVATLYQHFKILNDLLRKCNNARTHAAASFKEEFK